ncbi:hypothetical protein GCM10022224_103540 [Nonomuraea antimicrobica]|uniref:DUF5709 domain-containing protein n=1 Tax=Nonomuraea antimicrobica TaxID=561173 RepID=A0ABP7ELH9_9ACTN
MRQNEPELVATGVDRREWGPSEADEEQILAGLYGPPDDDGVYRGAADGGASPGASEATEAHGEPLEEQ